MSKKIYLYEILVRGTPDGKIAGAHQIKNEIFIDDETGDVIADRQGPAEVLSADDVSGIVGASFVATAGQISALQGRVQAAEAEATTLRSSLANANALIAKLTAANAQIAKIVGDVTTGETPT